MSFALRGRSCIPWLSFLFEPFTPMDGLSSMAGGIYKISFETRSLKIPVRRFGKVKLERSPSPLPSPPLEREKLFPRF
jgi:hypothetical protein